MTWRDVLVRCGNTGSKDISSGQSADVSVVAHKVFSLIPIISEHVYCPFNLQYLLFLLSLIFCQSVYMSVIKRSLKYCKT